MVLDAGVGRQHRPLLVAGDFHGAANRFRRGMREIDDHAAVEQLADEPAALLRQARYVALASFARLTVGVAEMVDRADQAQAILAPQRVELAAEVGVEGMRAFDAKDAGNDVRVLLARPGKPPDKPRFEIGKSADLDELDTAAALRGAGVAERLCLNQRPLVGGTQVAADQPLANASSGVGSKFLSLVQGSPAVGTGARVTMVKTCRPTLPVFSRLRST